MGVRYKNINKQNNDEFSNLHHFIFSEIKSIKLYNQQINIQIDYIKNANKTLLTIIYLLILLLIFLIFLLFIFLFNII